MRIVPNEPKATSTCHIYYPKNCKVSNIFTLLWHTESYCCSCCLVFWNDCSSWEKEKRKYLACSPLVYFLLISSTADLNTNAQQQGIKIILTEDGKSMLLAKILVLWRIWQLLVCHFSFCPFSPPLLNSRIRWLLHLWQCSQLNAGDCQK